MSPTYMKVIGTNNKIIQSEAISPTVSVLKSREPNKVTMSAPTEQIANLTEEATVGIHSMDFISDQSQVNNPTNISGVVDSQLLLQVSEKPEPSFPVTAFSLNSPYPRKVFFHRRQNIFGNRSQWIKYFQSFQHFQKSYLFVFTYQLVKTNL